MTHLTCVSRYRRGSVVAEILYAVLDHPDANATLESALVRLGESGILGRRFPGASFNLNPGERSGNQRGGGLNPGGRGFVQPPQPRWV